MVIRQEQIEELIRKTGVSYEDAEKLLEKTRGDVRKAIERIEKKENSSFKKGIDAISDALFQLLNYKLIIKRNGEILLNLPIVIIIALLLFFDNVSFFEIFILLLLVLLADCQLKIEKKVKDKDIEDIIIIKPTKTIHKTREEVDESSIEVTEEGYNEIVIKD